MIKIGQNEYIAEENITQVVTGNSTLLKTRIKNYKDNDSPLLYDYRGAKATKSIVITKYNEIILTNLSPETIVGRIEKVRERKLRQKYEIAKGEINNVEEN